MRLTMVQLQAPTAVFMAAGCWLLDCWTSPVMLLATATMAFVLGHLSIGAAAWTLGMWYTHVAGRPKTAPTPSPLHPDLPPVAEPSLEEELWFAFERAALYRAWGVEAIIRGVYQICTQPTVQYAEDTDQVEALMGSVAFQYMERTKFARLDHRSHAQASVNDHMARKWKDLTVDARPPRPPQRVLHPTESWGDMSVTSVASAEHDSDEDKFSMDALTHELKMASPANFGSLDSVDELCANWSDDTDESEAHPQAVSTEASKQQETATGTTTSPSRAAPKKGVRFPASLPAATPASPKRAASPAPADVASPQRSSLVRTFTSPSPRAMTALVRQRSHSALVAKSPSATATAAAALSGSPRRGSHPTSARTGGMIRTMSAMVQPVSVPSPQRELRNQTEKPDEIAPKPVKLPPVQGLLPDEEVWTMDLSMFEDCKCYGGVYFKGVIARFARSILNHRKPRYLDITIVGNGTFYPPSENQDPTSPRGDPESWKLAKLFVMQAVSYNALWVDHTATHLPLDSFTAISLSVLPEYHVVYQLIKPHTLHTLALEDSLFWAPGSPVNHDETQWYKTWAHGRDEHLKKLVYGCKQHFFSRRVEEIQKKNNLPGAQFLLEHHAVVHAFVSRVLDVAGVDPTTDVHLLEWEKQLADNVVGLQNIADAENPREALADVLSIYIFEVSVRHSYDHQSLYHHIPIEWAPLRISVPPPVEGRRIPKEMMDPRNVVHKFDYLKHRIFADVFMQWSRNPLQDKSLSKTQYPFRTEKLQTEAARFRQELMELNQRLGKKMGKWHLATHLIAPSIQW